MTLAVHGRGQVGASAGLRLVGHCLRLVLLVDVRRVAALAVVLCRLREGVVTGRAIAGAVRRLGELSAGGSVGRLYLLLMIPKPRTIRYTFPSHRQSTYWINSWSAVLETTGHHIAAVEIGIRNIQHGRTGARLL